MSNKGCLFVIFEIIKKIIKENKTAKNYPYQSKNWIMTKAEISFYHCLKNCLSPEDHSVFTKVRLEDLIEVKKGSEDYNSHRNRIKSRHVDFVICDARTGEIQRIIELNDSSHFREDRIERDDFIRQAINTAGIKLIEVKAQRAYTKEDILLLFD